MITPSKPASVIDSRTHPSVKRIRLLRLRDERERTGLFYIEGLRFLILPAINERGVLALLALSPSCDGASCKVSQTDESTDSGPHTNLGFGGRCLFFRPFKGLSLTAHARIQTLSGLHPTERASWHLPSWDNYSTRVLRRQLAKWPGREDASLVFWLGSIPPVGGGLFIPRMNNGGFQARS